MSSGDLAQLELELRKLHGVVLVSFGERDEATVIELLVEGDAAIEAVSSQARRLAESQIDGAVTVVVRNPERPAPGRRGSRHRVQLLAVAPLGGERLEVHLAYRNKRVTSSCRAGDRVAVAGAVLDGLGKLGLGVPFEATAVHLLTGELGDGALVQLRHESLDGTRRGLAGGHREEEAIARAVLNGLNRYLEGGAGPHDGHGDTAVLLEGDGALPAAG